MTENEAPNNPKRLLFYPSSVVLNAFNKFREKEGISSDAKALEFLTREGLQERDLLPRRKKQ